MTLFGQDKQSGGGGWEEAGAAPRPGEMRLWTYQAIAHGADAIVYFRWRTARYGTEQFWQGVLDHHGQPRRRYRELQTIGAEIKRLGRELFGAESRSQVAMILSYDSRFAFQGQPNHGDFDYEDLFQSYYAALHRRNIGVDIVCPTADLSRYRLVLAPTLYVLTQEVADKLRSYVEGGGTLLVTTRSGVKDEANATVEAPLPGLLSDICGVEVEEYDAHHADHRVALEWEETITGWVPSGMCASLWCDVLTPSTAETVAGYQSEFYAGRAAITLNHLMEGQAAYVGTIGNATLHDAVVEWLLRIAGASPALPAFNDVEVLERWKEGRRLLFLLNHTGEEQEVELPETMIELLANRPVAGRSILEPTGVMILQPSRERPPTAECSRIESTAL